MFRPLELYIGTRYIRAKRRNHFISFISVVSMLGLVIGLTALITVISVMNGFDGELRSRTLAMLGLVLCAFSIVLIVSQAIPEVMLGGCE